MEQENNQQSHYEYMRISNSQGKKIQLRFFIMHKVSNVNMPVNAKVSDVPELQVKKKISKNKVLLRCFINMLMVKIKIIL